MGKFFDISCYEESKDYELLPFKFDRFDENSYIITNIIGEYLIIENHDFLDFVNNKISQDTPLFKDLRAKHFLRFPDEENPIELLAIKLRTKFSRLANFTNLHVFVVTLRCDHSCPYCQVSRKSESIDNFDMTKEMADKALDFVFRSPNPAIKIEFQGGEPLLNFDLIKYIVKKAVFLNLSYNRDLQFVIATTLSLINKDVLEFCKEYNIFISSSLDGTQKIHDKNRPRAGNNSHFLFENGLKEARETLGFDRVSALMTTTEESLNNVKSIIDEYIRLEFDGIFLRALSPYGFAIKTKKYMKYDTERWLRFYKEGLSYIIEINRSGTRFVEHYASIFLQKILTNNDPGFVDIMNPSGAGIAAIVFNYEGSIYASDESRMLAEMGDNNFRLGSVLTNSYEEIILSDSLIDTLENSFSLSVPMCSDCSFEPFCGTDPVYHYAIHNDVVGKKAESSFCYRNMEIIKHLIKLMESDKEIKNIFMGWVGAC